MFALLQVGPFVEKLLGNRGFIATYLLSGLAGSMVSLAWNPFAVGVGASGAIFGLYGALLGFLILRKDTVPSDELSRLMQIAIVFVGYNTIYGGFKEGTDLAAHAGGLVAGFLCGLALSAPLTPEMVAKRAPRAMRLALAGAAVLVVGALALPRPGDLLSALEKLGPVEKMSLAIYNDALIDIKEGRIQLAGMADLIERDILPPWSAERDTLAKISPQISPGKRRQTIERIVAYMTARQEAWKITAQGVRAHNVLIVNQGMAKQSQVKVDKD